jgi:hypothetical protein
MRRSTLTRVGIVAGICVVVGALGGIAGSAAAPSKKGHSAQDSTSTEPRPAPGGKPFGIAFVGNGPPVHGEFVVPNKDGTGFETTTMDDGEFKSLSGDQLTITEGTKSATYKDATLTIPSDAKVIRNFDDAKLSDLKDGDHVHVDQSPEKTVVFALDADHQKQGPPDGRGFHVHAEGAVPPGAPPPPMP